MKERKMKGLLYLTSLIIPIFFCAVHAKDILLSMSGDTAEDLVAYAIVGDTVKFSCGPSATTATPTLFPTKCLTNDGSNGGYLTIAPGSTGQNVFQAVVGKALGFRPTGWGVTETETDPATAAVGVVISTPNVTITDAMAGNFITCACVRSGIGNAATTKAFTVVVSPTCSSLAATCGTDATACKAAGCSYNKVCFNDTSTTNTSNASSAAFPMMQQPLGFTAATLLTILVSTMWVFFS